MSNKQSADIPVREKQSTQGLDGCEADMAKKSPRSLHGNSGEDRGMKNGKPFPLPKTWTASSIGKFVVKTKQRDPRKTPNDLFHYVDVSAVSNTSFKITRAAPTLGSEAPSRARKAIQTDDVLFATVRPTLKRIALVPLELDGAIASTGYCVLRCDKAKADPGFLYSFLITDHFTARMAGLERGASYNISPSRYIHTSDAETYRPIAEIVEELKVIEAEALETDKALQQILKQLGVGA